MSSIGPTLGHFSSSDWILLSEFLGPNYRSMTQTKQVKNMCTEVTQDDIVSLNSCNDDISNFLLKFEANDAILPSIPKEHNENCLQLVWNSECSTLSEINPTSDFTSKFKQIRDDVLSGTILPPENYSELVFKKSGVPSADAGVQTMSPAIHTFPEDCWSLPIPWGLETDEPSPLIKSLPKSKKRKLDDFTLPPNKRPALENQDPFKLNDIFGFLQQPIVDIKEADRLTINEDGMVAPLTSYMYEGVTDIALCTNGSRCVATNTLHVPMRHGPTQSSRQKIWRQAAKQYLSVEDRLSKREPRQGSQKDRNQRMVDEIMSYYCR